MKLKDIRGPPLLELPPAVESPPSWMRITPGDRKRMLDRLEDERGKKDGFPIARHHFHLRGLEIETAVTREDVRLMRAFLEAQKKSHTTRNTLRLYYFMKELGLPDRPPKEDYAGMLKELEGLRAHASDSKFAPMYYHMRELGIPVFELGDDERRMMRRSAATWSNPIYISFIYQAVQLLGEDPLGEVGRRKWLKGLFDDKGNAREVMLTELHYYGRKFLEKPPQEEPKNPMPPLKRFG
jgi:hypothetical protein